MGWDEYIYPLYVMKLLINTRIILDHKMSFAHCVIVGPYGRTSSERMECDACCLNSLQNHYLCYNWLFAYNVLSA